MRIIAIILVVLLAVVGCKDKPNANRHEGRMQKETPRDTTQFTTVQWLDSVQTYNKLNEGQKLEVAFRFKNTGDKPLVIYSIRPSCGCTVIDQPEKPIAPGETSVIKGSFNSEGKPGQQHKTIFVSASTKGNTMHQLEFNVEVIKKS